MDGIDPYWRKIAAGAALRSKKAELTEALARALHDHSKAERENGELRSQLHVADVKLTDCKTITKAFHAAGAALAKEHNKEYPTVKAALAEIVEKSEEIVAAVSEREENERVIEEMTEERARMLRALGMTEDQWFCKGWRY